MSLKISLKPLLKVSLRQSRGQLKRKGIALLITIALVATITALLTVSTGILDHSFKRISNKLLFIQSNVFFKDFVGILKQSTNEVNSSATLDIFLMIPISFAPESQEVSFDVSFVSDASTININQLLSTDVNLTELAERHEPIPVKVVYESYLDHILSVYSVSDKILLLAMIADSVDDDIDERVAGSEIALKNPLFSQGTIYNLQHFQQILEAYVRETVDYSVFKIPWHELIGFENESVDFNHISKEVLYHTAPELQDNIALYTTERIEVYDSLDTVPVEESTKKNFEELGITFYSPNVRGTMRVVSGDKTMEMAFSYNLKTKEVSHIEVTN